MQKNIKYRVKRANKGSGLGLFAERDFKKDEFIIEYTGELIPTKVADERNSKYLFTLNSRWVVDGASRKNFGRYLNHSCRPNCEAEISGRKIIIRAKKKIKTGEELVYDYGKEYFDEYIKPKGCKCQKCVSSK